MGVGCLLIPVVTLILILKFVSDRRPARIRPVPSGSALSIPPPGRARILARKIADTPTRVEWQWTIVGDRNWTVVTARTDGYELGGAYAFNSQTTLGGTHIWIVDLSVSKPGGDTAAQLRVDSSIHGSNGTTQTQAWNAGSGPPTVTAIQADDALVSIPADLNLAAVSGRNLTLRIKSQ
jgi:hypothetical protein